MLDFAKDESGTISFRFQANGITPTTFESKRANPSIEARVEWPAFYRAHEADFEKMWEAAEKRIFSSESQTTDLLSEDEDDDMFGKRKIDDDDLN